MSAWEPWPDDTAICVVCGGPLPEFPARLVSGDNESGPLCGCCSVPIAASQSSPYAKNNNPTTKET